MENHFLLNFVGVIVPSKINIIKSITKTTKPHELIYITGFLTPTIQDGDCLTLIALDDFSKFMFPPKILKQNSNDNEFIDSFVQFFNSINANYDRKIHAQKTTYYTDLPVELHPLMKGFIMKEDTIVFKPELVQKQFKPIFDKRFK